MIERLLSMLVKEFRQLFADPKMKRMLFIAPIVQILVFGYAASTDIRDVRTVIYDLDNTPQSRELVADFTAGGYFRVRHRIGDDREMRSLLDHSSATCVVKFSPGFGAAVRAGRTAPVQLLLDGTDPNSASVIVSYASRIIDRYNADRMAERLAALGAQAQPMGGVTLRSRAWFNENLESRNYYLPGVIAQLVMIMTLMLSSIAVVREKEVGTIEQIMVTPIRQVEFILGKTVPFALVGFAQVLLITTVAVFWFGVPFRGNFALLLGATGLFILSMLGIGLFISTISSTQQQAMMTTFFITMPAILLSGFMYPIENMPETIRWITYLDPLRFFLVIIRSIFLKGIGFDLLKEQFAALAVLGVVFLGLATSRFRKTVS